MKHTPGPWKVVDAKTTKRGVRAKNGYICFLTDVQRYPNQEERFQQEMAERECNAHLIAAAPEMYEALKRIEMGCSFPSDDVQKTVRDVARAALAKAEGQ